MVMVWKNVLRYTAKLLVCSKSCDGSKLKLKTVHVAEFIHLALQKLMLGNVVSRDKLGRNIVLFFRTRLKTRSSSALLWGRARTSLL